MRLDCHLAFDETSDADTHHSELLRQMYRRDATYTPLSDWQLKAPKLSRRLTQNVHPLVGNDLSVLIGFNAELDWVLLEDRSPDLLATVGTDSRDNIRVVALSMPWHADPTIAFFRHFWIHPECRRRSPSRDSALVFAVLLHHMHDLASASFVAMATPASGAYLRGIALDRAPVLRAAALRESLDDPAPKASGAGPLRILLQTNEVDSLAALLVEDQCRISAPSPGGTDALAIVAPVQYLSACAGRPVGVLFEVVDRLGVGRFLADDVTRIFWNHLFRFDNSDLLIPKALRAELDLALAGSPSM